MRQLPILPFLFLGLLFLACSKDEASIAGPSRIDTLIVVHKDTIIVNQKDTIIVSKRDTVIISKRDTMVVKDSIYTWSEIIDKNKEASYAFGLRDNKSSSFILIGSGAAINDTTLCTNAHVALALAKQYIIYKQVGLDVSPVAVPNGSFSLGANVIALDIGAIHKDYDESTVFTNDVAIFYSNSKLPSKFQLAPQSELENIKSGENIGTLGFPGETASRIEKQIIATFKDGVVSAQNTFNTNNAVTPQNAFIIQHNFNTTGGTSGSPIFNTKGNVISLNNAGGGTWIWDDTQGDFKFIGQGSIGYSVRVDILGQILNKSKAILDTISSYYIPTMYRFVPGEYLSNPDGSQPVFIGSSVVATITEANKLFKHGPDFTYEDGSVEYTDNAAYTVTFLKEEGVDRIWSALIKGAESEFYLPSFRDRWGTTIGSSRNFIFDTYGSNYNVTFSIDSTNLYYTYSTTGVGFGFKISESDWNCDLIQIALPNQLAKVGASENLVATNRKEQLTRYLQYFNERKKRNFPTKGFNLKLKKVYQ